MQETSRAHARLQVTCMNGNDEVIIVERHKNHHTNTAADILLRIAEYFTHIMQDYAVETL